MEVGEFIRINGKFDKIKEIDLKKGIVRCKKSKFWLDDIHKHSFNIIDLLEIGDHVNGKELIEIEENITDDGRRNRNLVCIGGSILELSNNIKKILPHEWVELGTYNVEVED